MTGHDLHALYQQMGEVLTGLRCMHETIEIRRLQSEKQADIAHAALTSIRAETRDLEDKLNLSLTALRLELERQRQEVICHRQSIDELALAIQRLQRPVAEMVALRSRMGGLLVTLGAIGSAALWLAEPFYRWLVDSLRSLS